jgi:hypothetical protein
VVLYKPVLRDHLWDNESGVIRQMTSLKRYDMIILANAIEKHVLRVISDLKLTKRSK